MSFDDWLRFWIIAFFVLPMIFPESDSAESYIPVPEKIPKYRYFEKNTGKYTYCPACKNVTFLHIFRSNQRVHTRCNWCGKASDKSDEESEFA